MDEQLDSVKEMHPLLKPEQQTEVLRVADEGNALRVVDQQSYDFAAEFLREIKERLKKVASVFDPIQVAQRQAANVTRQQRNRLEEPLLKAKIHIGSETASFTRRMEAEQQELQRQTDEIARKEEEERRIKEAEAAEAAGASKATVTRVLDQPVPAPRPKVAPVFQKAKGQSVRKNYSAVVESLGALVEAVHKGKVPITALQANQPFLNAQARALKETLNYPGVKLVIDSTTMTR